jgi:hypothetical protein
VLVIEQLAAAAVGVLTTKANAPMTTATTITPRKSFDFNKLLIKFF